MAGKRNIRLRTISDCNHFLAKLINQLKRDEIDPSKAGKLTYMLNVLIKGLRDAETEQRLLDLEQQLQKLAVALS
jgi:hypothetical protein